MGLLADLYGTVRIDGASVGPTLDSINGKLKATQGNMASLESSLVSWGKSFIGVAAVTATLGMGLNEIAGDERALTRLTGVLKATGNAAGLSATDLAAYARQLQDLTGIQDDVTMSAMALLATHNLSEPVLKTATALAQDMSILYGDVASSAGALGKALEDPLEGLGLLERMMKVKASPAMRELIAQFVELGDTAKAQALILDFVKSKVGGLAEAAGNDLTGDIEKLKRAWEDLAASAAKPVTFVVKLVTDFLKGGKNVIQDVEDYLENRTPAWARPAMNPRPPANWGGFDVPEGDARPQEYWDEVDKRNTAKMRGETYVPPKPPEPQETPAASKSRAAFGAAAADMREDQARVQALAEAGTEAERRRLQILYAEQDAYARLTALVEKLYGSNIPAEALRGIEEVRQAIEDAAQAKRAALAEDEAAAAADEDAEIERNLERMQAELDHIDEVAAAQEAADEADAARTAEDMEDQLDRQLDAMDEADARKAAHARRSASSLLDMLATEGAAGDPAAQKHLWIERQKAELAEIRDAIVAAEGALSEEQADAFANAEEAIGDAADRRFASRRTASSGATSTESYLRNLQAGISRDTDAVPALVGITNTRLEEIREILRLGSAVTE